MPVSPLNPADLSSYRYVVDEHVRFSDTDMIGHVNNVAHVALVETGRVAYVISLGKQAGIDIQGIMFARLEIDFRDHLFHPAQVQVGARVTEIGRTSFRVAVGVFDQGRCVTTSLNVMVHVGPDGRPVAISDAFRAVLAAEVPSTTGDVGAG